MHPNRSKTLLTHIRKRREKSGVLQTLEDARRNEYVNTRPWHAGNIFKEAKSNSRLSLIQLRNLGEYEKEPRTAIAKTYLRVKVPPIHTWKYVGKNSGLVFYDLGKGVRVAVNPELAVLQPMRKIGKGSQTRLKRMLPVLTELVKRRVRIETPLGLIMTKKGETHYVVRIKKGIALTQRMVNASATERKLIAKSMGREMADIHNKGVVHGHPHENNWLIEGTKARLVDSKGVSFKEEYPYTFKMTGRTLTWGEVVNNGLVHIEILFKNYGGLFKEFMIAYSQHSKG